MAGGPEDGETDQRQEHGVEAGDGRRAGNPGVPEDLRDVHRGQRDAGERVADGAAASEGPEPAEERQAHSDNADSHIAALSRRRPGVTPHILRHTAAAWMAMAGVPMAVIARLLGHTD